MANLDVTDVIAVEFIVDTVVTAPDGNTYTTLAGSRYGVPVDELIMSVSVAGPVNCMLKSSKRTQDNVMPQVFCVDEVRSAV